MYIFFFLVVLMLISLQGRAGLVPSSFCLDFKPPTRHISTSSNATSQNASELFHSDCGNVPIQMYRNLNMNVAMRKNISTPNMTLNFPSIPALQLTILPSFLCNQQLPYSGLWWFFLSVELSYSLSIILHLSHVLLLSPDGSFAIVSSRDVWQNNHPRICVRMVSATWSSQ